MAGHFAPKTESQVQQCHVERSRDILLVETGQKISPLRCYAPPVEMTSGGIGRDDKCKAFYTHLQGRIPDQVGDDEKMLVGMTREGKTGRG